MSSDSPWLGEPIIMTGPDNEPVLGEVLTCTGHAISGGDVAHLRACAFHARDVDRAAGSTPDTGSTT